MHKTRWIASARKDGGGWAARVTKIIKRQDSSYVSTTLDLGVYQAKSKALAEASASTKTIRSNPVWQRLGARFVETRVVAGGRCKFRDKSTVYSGVVELCLQ